ncbi:hypothetical protein PG985_013915 [Apiospora marii]|uniref:Uncharacterized protein n=1 Tax=Apiospora marii TaxID=335849 RepID=A0ABR1R6H3_9PEZI
MTSSSSSSVMKNKISSKSKNKPKRDSTKSPCLRAYLQQSPTKENRLIAKSDAVSAAEKASAVSSKSSVEKMSMNIEKIMAPFEK